MKTIVIAAGTGFLGNILVKHFKTDFQKVIVLTRGKPKIQENIEYITWDAKTLTGWQDKLEKSEVLINLTGKSVNCRYTPKNKKEILNSRNDSTQILNEAILGCKHPPIHFINSSTATIYRHSKDKQMDEFTGETGNDFSMGVAKKWEETFFKTATPHTLKTAIRTAIVLGKKGGAWIPLKRLAKMGFGGKQGDGEQFMSWVHETDFARSIEFIISTKMDGIVNIVSSQPIKNKIFMKILCDTLNMPLRIPNPKPMLEIGAFLIGTETELVIKSRNVIPRRLLEKGYVHRVDNIKQAFQELLS
jgi:uncharacterized protein